MSFRLAAGFALAMTFTMSSESALPEESTIAIDHRGTFARPVERIPPNYPRRELYAGNQGWVKLSFVVTEDGEVIDPVVTDSSGGHRFEREALRSIRQWEFEPATWDGEPVQQCKNDHMMTFRIEDAEAFVTPRFYRRYREANEALDEGDIAKAEREIAALSELAMTTYERARHSLLQARVAETTGDADAQLIHLRRVVASNGFWIDEELYPQLLYLVVALEIQTGRHSAALRSWERLTELDTGALDLAPLASAIENINVFVAGPEVMFTQATLRSDEGCEDCNADWLHYPLRRQIAFADIDGEIENLEIRCDWQRIVDDVSDNKTWQIPESWGDCRILVTGEPGTTFKLVEIPG